MQRRQALTLCAAAPALIAQTGRNNAIRLGIVGVGTRGIYLLEQFQNCPDTEIRWIADLYDANLQRAVNTCKNKNVQTTKEWEKVATAADVDAVIIATPDFWHAPMTIKAAEAKKDVYVEKGLCRTLDEAKAIRKAVRANRVILQLGHNQNSDPSHIKAREIFESGKLGKVTLVRTFVDRTNAYPEWQFYTAYDIQQTPADANQKTVDWNRFIANAPERPFDVQRFFRWRCYWDYGTGIAGDLMSHMWDGINGIMRMGIPEGVITQGGLYFWKEDRDVPDQWHVVFDYPKRDLAIQFGCTFHNDHQGRGTYILGREASLEVGMGSCQTFDAAWKKNARKEPTYRMEKNEVKVSSHMQDFLDSIRTRSVPRCGMDRAFEEAVTIVMSVEAYFKERKVKWDPVNELII